MKYFLQVLSTHSRDTSPAVMVHFDSARYLFNCGEGTQRLYFEQKRRIGKLRTIFLTRAKWEVLGGIPGMILTLADTGLKDIRIYGPRNLAHVLAATRSFVRRDGIHVAVRDILSPDDFEYVDENLRVCTVALLPHRDQQPAMGLEHGHSSCSSDGDGSGSDHGDDGARPPQVSAGTKRNRCDSDNDQDDAASESTNRQPVNSDSGIRKKRLHHHKQRNQNVVQRFLKSVFRGAPSTTQLQPATSAFDDRFPTYEAAEPISRHLQGNRLPSTTDENVALCYICQGPESVGRLDVAVAIRLGVVPGPSMGKLKAGESVLARDGSTVHPSQCVEPNKPGAIFIIIDCPSTNHIQSLIENEKLAKVAAAIGDFAAKCVIHMCSNGVLEDARYLAWMQSFPSTTQHIYFSEKHNRQDIVFRSHANVQFALNSIDKDIFQMPFCAPGPVPISGLPAKSRPAEMQLTFQFEPKVKLDATDCLPKLKFDDTKERKQLMETAKKAIQIFSETTPFQPETLDERHREIALTTLGTASAIPGKYRNVSSSILETPSGTIMFDSGEGTLGQIYRRFGPDGLRTILSSLSLVFVSHMHADHHLGLISVLVERNAILQQSTASSPAGSSTAATPSQPLIILGPKSLWTWLKEYSQVEDIGLHHLQFVNASDVLWHSNRPDDKQLSMDKATLARMGLARVQAVSVVHCRPSYAIVLETTSGFKFAFSGDCRPSSDFAEAARNADILLHEATLDDEMTAEAIAKAHCTIGEAIQVGREMRAKNILLTHFSQRYPKLPTLHTRSSPLPESGSFLTNVNAYQPVIGVAFDLMRIRLHDFWKLPLFVPSLKSLFSEEDVLELEK